MRCISRSLAILPLLLISIGCQTGGSNSAGTPMGAAPAAASVVVLNEGVDLSTSSLASLQAELAALRKTAGDTKQLTVSEYVRAVRLAGEARNAARVGTLLAGQWSAGRSITLAPAMSLVLSASCYSASAPSAAAPAEGEAFAPAESIEWVAALARSPSDPAAVQGAIWNLMSNVPFASLPPEQQTIVRAALPDAEDRFPAVEGAPAPVDARAMADGMAARTSAEGPVKAEALRLANGLILKIKHRSGIQATDLAISVDASSTESLTFDPTSLLFVPRRSDVTRLALSAFPDLRIVGFTALKDSADAMLASLRPVTIENIPWSGRPEEFYALFTGNDLETGAPLPRFDRAIHFGLLAIQTIESKGKGIRALGDAAKETPGTGSMVRIAEGCYEFFLAIGRKSPNRLPIKRSYRFGPAVRETVAFLGPGAAKGDDGVFASADGARSVTFDAEKSTILFSLGGKQKRVRLE